MLRTYDEWQDKGYQVRRGEKASSKNSYGTALFTDLQVKPRKPFDDYDESDYEYDRDMGDVYFHDKDWY